MFALFLCLSTPAGAGVILDAGIKGTIEDNITGSSADVDKDGDFYSTLSVTAGVYREIEEATRFLIIKGGAEVYTYKTYDELSAVNGFVSAGIYRRYSEALSSSVTFQGAARDYEDDNRDSLAAGVTLEFKEQITGRFWLKQAYEYEVNDAASGLFSYTAHAVGVWAGIAASSRAFYGLGYSYLDRQYDSPADFESQSHTLSLFAELLLVPTVFLVAGYDRQWYAIASSDPKYDNQKYDNTIATIGLQYSY